MNSLKQSFAWVCTVLLAVSTWAAAQQSPQSGRIKYNFNPGWKLATGEIQGAEAPAFNDGAWRSVTLPRAFNEDAAFKVAIGDLPTSISWWRKGFTVPADSADKKLFLEFEGIRHGCEFYLNGTLLGRHENGVMAFGFDITDKVKPAPAVNILAARIDNSWRYKEQATGSTFQWNDRNFYANYGGINKNVYLHVTDKLHQTLPLYSSLGTTGVYVYAQDYDIKGASAKITAESQVKNDTPAPRTFEYEVAIEDLDGKPVKTFTGGQTTLAPGEMKTVSASARVDGLHFWSWGYGYLYTVSTILKVDGKPVDVVRTRTGFRKTEFGHGMVKLNDRAIQMHGYGQRTTNEWPAIGLSVPAWMSDLSNKLMVESGGNLVRWMHVTPWKQDVESCDRVGLIQAMPAGDSEGDARGRRWEQRLEVMRDAIIYNRNNPSILFYESGNKGVSEEHMAQMKALRDQWDPHGGRASGAREMLASKTAEYGGEMLYINKSAGKLLWAMEYSRDEGLRKYWDELTPPYHKVPTTNAFVKGSHNAAPAYEYNRNQDSHAIEDVLRWFDYWHERPGTGERVSGGGVNIIFSDSNTHYRGAQNYRRSGEVDALRLPKDGFFAHQVMWDGWVDIERPRAAIIGHWNYAPGTKKDVYVVSSAEKVELFLNGKSQGFGAQSSRFLYTFKNIEWQPGTLKAVGYDAASKPVCEAGKVTASQPEAIRLTVHTGPKGLKADGADLALVDVEVVDAQGRRCPTALDMINFSLAGPGEWRGGIAQDDDQPDNYILAQSLPVQCGVNRVIIRSAAQAGKITLSATAKGLKPASAEIVSQPVEVEGGLALDLPGTGLPVNLERGPTPATPSFTVTRKPVRIAAATAGVNSDKASLTFDDNETTGWSNDGKMETAWVNYEFEKPARASEVTLKPGGWRTKSYPVRITVDGKQVYAGATPRSLGYVTLTFPPTDGKSLKLELTGGASEKDAFDIVEITGKKDLGATGAKPATGKGTLNIMELEIYEPVR